MLHGDVRAWRSWITHRDCWALSSKDLNPTTGDESHCRRRCPVVNDSSISCCCLCCQRCATKLADELLTATALLPAARRGVGRGHVRDAALVVRSLSNLLICIGSNGGHYLGRIGFITNNRTHLMAMLRPVFGLL